MQTKRTILIVCCSLMAALMVNTFGQDAMSQNQVIEARILKQRFSQTTVTSELSKSKPQRPEVNRQPPVEASQAASDRSSLSSENSEANRQNQSTNSVHAGPNRSTILTGAAARLHDRNLKPPVLRKKNEQVRRQHSTVQNTREAMTISADSGELARISGDKLTDRETRLTALRQLGTSAPGDREVTDQLRGIAHDNTEDAEIRQEALLSLLKCNRILPVSRISAPNR